MTCTIYILTPNDGTQIVHSDVMYDESGKELVEVYVEKPVKLGFKSAYCYLPAYKWDNVDGFDWVKKNSEKLLRIWNHDYPDLAEEGEAKMSFVRHV